MKFGVHTSIAGGIDQAVVRAAKLDCGTFQIFSTNPRGWKAKEISDKEAQSFKDALAKYNLETVVVHTPYLINLASPKEHIYKKSIIALIAGIKRADQIGAKYMVLHPGSHTGAGIEQGIENIAKGLLEVIAKSKPAVNILLENVAGAGTAIGRNIEELERIIKQTNNHNNLGICYDTCHGFAAGYDIRQKEEVDRLLEEIDCRIGLDRLGVIHANDSIGDLGSNKDRHHHIGEGQIGLAGFRNLVNHPKLKDKAFILETPVDEQKNDQDNLATIKSLVE
ncbi:endonuclease IV [Orenia metallireducens]|uniref:Probable endonuclease 4 n=1 Tax=Orenia metallireducens TaxID=1413210 RepID=A0A285FPP2_9FIRM|nr:deoxyribonuclease IV [Orenia metallireducens]PRX33618.1 endonuclease IV [Orenia metallireducens]SNY12191.1 Endonuclease IV [Orenia metallireducens]